MPLDSPSKPRLILASASPRRRRLLEEAGYRFSVEPANLDEDAHCDGSIPPRQQVEKLAVLKAHTVAQQYAGECVVVLAADTIVVSSTGEVLNKPADRVDARRILLCLSGTLHHVITGFCCTRCDDGRQVSRAEVSAVLMRRLSEADLEAYLDRGQWEGKAGAYGIQDDPGRQIGEGDPFIESVSGELTNIVGLPMPQVIESLAKLGVVSARAG